VPEAIGHYELALRLKPNAAKTRRSLAKALLQQGRVAEAIGHLEQVLLANPGDAEAHNSLGVALFQLGRTPEAVAHLEQALRVNPEDGAALYNLGKALIRLGKAREAIGQYEHALRVNPEDVETQNDLACMLATCEDGSVRNGVRAVELAEKANQIARGKDPVILDTLAAAYAEAGRFGEAVRTAQAAIELANGQPEQVRQIQERLRLYQAGRPWHEDTVSVPGIKVAP